MSVEKPEFAIADEKGNMFVPESFIIHISWPSRGKFCTMTHDALLNAIDQYMTGEGVTSVSLEPQKEPS